MRGQIQSLRASEPCVLAFAARAEALSASLASVALDTAPIQELLSESELTRLHVIETIEQVYVCVTMHVTPQTIATLARAPVAPNAPPTFIVFLCHLDLTHPYYQ